MVSPKKEYGGYTFQTEGKLNKMRFFTTWGNIAGENFNQRVEVVGIRSKEDPNDTRMFVQV